LKYDLVLRPRADIDLASHFLYLSERNPRAALRFDKAIDAALKKIRTDPLVGARLVHSNVGHLEYRFYRPKGFRRYVIIYRLLDQTIYVTRILHGSQDVETALLDS
jgi:toxin ParE1/3/4